MKLNHVNSSVRDVVQKAEPPRPGVLNLNLETLTSYSKSNALGPEASAVHFSASSSLNP